LLLCIDAERKLTTGIGTLTKIQSPSSAACDGAAGLNRAIQELTRRNQKIGIEMAICLFFGLQSC
jgi:hypothetical protein